MSLEDIKKRWINLERRMVFAPNTWAYRALMKDLNKLFAVVEAAKEFYGTHECLGWGGHKGLGEALAALEKE